MSDLCDNMPSNSATTVRDAQFCGITCLVNSRRTLQPREIMLAMTDGIPDNAYGALQSWQLSLEWEVIFAGRNPILPGVGRPANVHSILLRLKETDPKVLWEWAHEEAHIS